MTKHTKAKTFGMYWHGHHSEWLLMASNNIQGRIDFIKKHKPKDEIELRLKLLKPVQGKLPDELVEAAWRWANYAESYMRLEAERDKLNDDYLSAQSSYLVGEINFDALEEKRKAVVAFDRRLGRARRAAQPSGDRLIEMYQKYSEAVKALHEVECVDCPWDGMTIFPQKGW